MTMMTKLVGKFAYMIEAAVKRMAAEEKATPEKVIATTGTSRITVDNCDPERGFLGYGYCDPYFGWLTPALEETMIILRSALEEATAIQLWNNGWTRAFLVAFYERNDEYWGSNETGDELYDKLEFAVRTRKGFVEWLMSGEIYGFNLPGHKCILKTKEELLLRNRKAH